MCKAGHVAEGAAVVYTNVFVATCVRAAAVLLPHTDVLCGHGGCARVDVVSVGAVSVGELCCAGRRYAVHMVALVSDSDAIRGAGDHHLFVFGVVLARPANHTGLGVGDRTTGAAMGVVAGEICGCAVASTHEAAGAAWFLRKYIRVLCAGDVCKMNPADRKWVDVACDGMFGPHQYTIEEKQDRFMVRQLAPQSLKTVGEFEAELPPGYGVLSVFEQGTTTQGVCYDIRPGRPETPRPFDELYEPSYAPPLSATRFHETHGLRHRVDAAVINPEPVPVAPPVCVAEPVHVPRQPALLAFARDALTFAKGAVISYCLWVGWSNLYKYYVTVSSATVNE